METILSEREDLESEAEDLSEDWIPQGTVPKSFHGPEFPAEASGGTTRVLQETDTSNKIPPWAAIKEQQNDMFSPVGVQRLFFNQNKAEQPSDRFKKFEISNNEGRKPSTAPHSRAMSYSKPMSDEGSVSDREETPEEVRTPEPSPRRSEARQTSPFKPLGAPDSFTRQNLQRATQQIQPNDAHVRKFISHQHTRNPSFNFNEIWTQGKKDFDAMRERGKGKSSSDQSKSIQSLQESSVDRRVTSSIWGKSESDYNQTSESVNALNGLGDFTDDRSEPEIMHEMSVSTVTHIPDEDELRQFPITKQKLCSALMQTGIGDWTNIMQLERIELANKGLEGFHGLDEYCPNLLELEVDSNPADSLFGIPPGVLRLSATDNMISSMTTFKFLHNLQSVDLSNNHLSDLGDLVSLRSLQILCLDNNKVRSLCGLGQLQGLRHLSVSCNELESVDFTDIDLPFIETIRLNSNKIDSVIGLGFETLQAFNIEDNQLETLEVSSLMPRLSILKASNNRLQTLNVEGASELSVLYADDNELSEIQGFERLQKLTSFSIRRQKFSCDLRGCAYSLRDLYLSGNGPPVKPGTLSGLYTMELQQCGLEELPDLKMPNLLYLDLQYNKISRMPKCYFRELQVLKLAHNNIVYFEGLHRLLVSLPRLRRLDLRDNPITRDFYPPDVDEDLGACEHALSCDSHWQEQVRVHQSKITTSLMQRYKQYIRLCLASSASLQIVDGIIAR